MLKTLHPALTGDLLKILKDMGHGDEIAVVDANYPTFSTAAHTVTGTPVSLPGLAAVDAVDAILSLMPLDTFVPCAAWRMEVVGDPQAFPLVQQEVQAAIDRRHGAPHPMGPIERMQYYDRAKAAYAIVATGERRHYGCFILKKGVIAPELALP